MGPEKPAPEGSGVPVVAVLMVVSLGALIGAIPLGILYLLGVHVPAWGRFLAPIFGVLVLSLWGWRLRRR